MGIRGEILWSLLPQIQKPNSCKEVSELKSNLIHIQTPRSIVMHVGLQSSNEHQSLVTSLRHHVPSFSDCHSYFMEKKHSFLCIECDFLPPEVHSLWTGFG